MTHPFAPLAEMPMDLLLTVRAAVKEAIRDEFAHDTLEVRVP